MNVHVQRPIGFRPWEVATLVNHRVVEIHASEAAFLWMQRNRAVQSPHFRLKHLARVDQRVDGHLEGLRVGADAAWAAAQAALAEADAGGVFVLTYLAFGSGNGGRMRQALQLGLSDPAFHDALIAGLVWLDMASLRPVLDRLQRSPDPSHQRVALSVLAAHRVDPGALLERAAASDHAALRARALRSIGEVKRHDLLSLARQAERDADADCRYWAARSLALLGDPGGAERTLAARAHDPSSRDAVDLAMRFGDVGWAHGVVRMLAAGSATQRLAIQAAGALGDAASVSWLVNQMRDVQVAQAAGEAFSMITGADLPYLDLHQDPPEDAPEESHPDDGNLPWPRHDAVVAWWAAEQHRFAPGQRCLGGDRITEASALQVLRGGYQRQRRAAALELVRLNTATALFPVAGRSDWQRRKLAA